MIDFSRLEEGAWVVVDTAPIIYLLEENPTFLASYLPLFEAIEAGRFHGVVSTITLAEVLGGPLKSGDEILADRYYQALTASSHWRVQEVNAPLSFMAARIRERYGLKLPDAIQVATTIYTNASALVTHDRDLSGVSEIPILGI